LNSENRKKERNFFPRALIYSSMKRSIILTSILLAIISTYEVCRAEEKYLLVEIEDEVETDGGRGRGYDPKWEPTPVPPVTKPPFWKTTWKPKPTWKPMRRPTWEQKWKPTWKPKPVTQPPPATWKPTWKPKPVTQPPPPTWKPKPVTQPPPPTWKPNWEPYNPKVNVKGSRWLAPPPSYGGGGVPMLNVPVGPPVDPRGGLIPGPVPGPIGPASPYDDYYGGGY